MKPELMKLIDRLIVLLALVQSDRAPEDLSAQMLNIGAEMFDLGVSKTALNVIIERCAEAGAKLAVQEGMGRELSTKEREEIAKELWGSLGTA